MTYGLGGGTGIRGASERPQPYRTEYSPKAVRRSASVRRLRFFVGRCFGSRRLQPFQRQPEQSVVDSVEVDGVGMSDNLVPHSEFLLLFHTARLTTHLLAAKRLHAMMGLSSLPTSRLPIG